MSSQADQVADSSDHQHPPGESAAPKTNAARRIYELLILANAYSPAAGQPITTLGMWAAVLGGDMLIVPEGPASPEYEDAAMSLLTDLRFQIRSVGTALRDHADYSGLVQPLILDATRLTSTQFLHTAWKDIKGQHFRPSLVSGWGLLAPWIPATDAVLALDRLRELIAAIREVENAALPAEIPTALRTFVWRQAAALRAGVMRYGISGTQHIRSALAQGFGELTRDSGPLTDASHGGLEQTKIVLSAFGKMWTLGARYCGDIVGYTDAVKLVYQTYNIVNNGLPLLQLISS